MFHKAVIIKRVLQVGIIALAIAEMSYLSVRVVDRCPDSDVGIHKLRTQQEVGLMGGIGTVTITYLAPIDAATTLGDDIDNGRESHIAIERRGRATKYLNMVDLLGADGIACGAYITITVVQTMAVLHDQNQFLVVAIGSVHGQVFTRVVGGYLGHSWHIGCQNLVEVLVVAQFLYHLSRDNRDGNRGLVDTLTLARSSSDSGDAALFDFLNQIKESWGILNSRRIIGVFLEYQFCIMMGFFKLVESQAAERQQTVATKAICTR